MPSILMQNKNLNITVNHDEKKVNKVLQDYFPAFMQLQGAVGDSIFPRQFLQVTFK